MKNVKKILASVLVLSSLVGFGISIASFASSFNSPCFGSFYGGDYNYEEFEFENENLTFAGSVELKNSDESSNIYTFEILGMINESIGVNETLYVHYDSIENKYLIFSINSNIKGYAFFVPKKLFDKEVDLEWSFSLSEKSINYFDLVGTVLYLPSKFYPLYLYNSVFFISKIEDYVNTISY